MECMKELDYSNAKAAISEKDTTISITGTPFFRMSDYLGAGTAIGNYRVTYVGKSFMKHFGSIEETDIPDTILKISTLKEWALDPAVIIGLGGPDMIPDNYMYHLIEIIKMGTDGPGIFNGYTNLFYKQSPVDGKLWSPHFYLRGDRLGFGALPACYDDGWEPGDRIFVRSLRGI